MEKNKKPSLFGNLTAASQHTRAVLRGEKKQHFSRDATETFLGSGRFLDKTAQQDREHSTVQSLGSVSSALTAEHSTMPQEIPPAWESVGKDQLRTPAPRDKQATKEASQVIVKYSCLPEMGVQIKKHHHNICTFLHFMCEAQLPRWF